MPGASERSGSGWAQRLLDSLRAASHRAGHLLRTLQSPPMSTRTSLLVTLTPSLLPRTSPTRPPRPPSGVKSGSPRDRLCRRRWYAAHADNCRRKREVVQHSVKLDWLREGKTRSEFSDFEQKWREELESAQREAHAEATAAAAAAEAEEAEVDADADAAGGGRGDGEGGTAPAEAEVEAEAGSFGEMD
mmetsp:Transcript_962/g.3864  ORF Transcript_962/g.3864 Transcript_962/m.3864 type:complete len:189 (+) Transcript_962:522-1088(+)